MLLFHMNRVDLTPANGLKRDKYVVLKTSGRKLYMKLTAQPIS